MNVGPHPEAADACRDWSERRPHLGDALGAALLTPSLRKAWVVPDLDRSRSAGGQARGAGHRLARFGMPF